MKNIDLKNFKGFAIVKNDNSKEAFHLLTYCTVHDIELLKLNSNELCLEDYIPCGSVEWCLKSLGKEITPDYYPDWLQGYLYRKVWEEDKWILGRKLFVKPSDKYKRFTGFVTKGTYSKKKKPPLIWSEVVEFKNEWRYYISNGKVLCSGWYWGDEINTPEPPELSKYNITIPLSYSGALDFGITRNGNFALVESQHPFACGWYRNYEEDYLYFQWLINGWEYMLSL